MIGFKGTLFGLLDVESPVIDRSLKAKKRRKKRKKKKDDIKRNLTVLEPSSRLLASRKPNPEVKNLLREIKLNSAKMTNMVSLT